MQEDVDLIDNIKEKINVVLHIQEEISVTQEAIKATMVQITAVKISSRE